MDFKGITICYLIVINLMIVYGYYYYAKKAILQNASKLVCLTPLPKHMPLAKAVGATELILIAIAHFLCCLIVMKILDVHWKQFGIELVNYQLVFYGILLGLGEMAFSTMLCKIIMSLFTLLIPKKSPKNLIDWLTLARSGWIRHHIQTAEVLPMVLTLLIIILQISSEEIMFRGIILNSFLPIGSTLAFVISTILFVYMQSFHMPNLFAAIFPMTGALVMGVAHCYLYLIIPTLVPLIIAHVTFFIISVL